MKVIYFVILCVSLYANVDSESAPFITPCHATDNDCLKNSAQKVVPILAAGIPAFGIDPMDPMIVDRVIASQAGLEMDFSNTTVTGLRNCMVGKLRRKDKQILLDMKCSVTLVGNYTLGGKLIFFQIEGNGAYKIRLRDILVKIMFQVEDKMVNDVNHWHIFGWKNSADVLTGAHYQFDNLFKGNKMLSDTIHQFANTSWRKIFREVAPPIVDAIVSTILRELQKLFDKVPVSELALS